MTFNLTALFDAWTYQFLLVFARVGGAIMLIPGLGDFRVPARVRLLFALILSALVVGNVADVLPATPPQFGQMVWQVVSEAGIVRPPYAESLAEQLERASERAAG